MMRYLPPTASPLALSDWAAGVAPRSRRKEAGDRFAAAVAGYLGVPTCHLASSGRTALAVALRALQAEPSLAGRREIVLPAYTCPSVAKVALDAGLRLRLVDVSPGTFGFDLDRLPEAVGQGTLAVVHVHPFGLPQPVEPALALARQAGAVLIEDAAQSLGARTAGRPAGTQGDLGLYSLGPGKPLSLGGGGVLSVNTGRWAKPVAGVWKALPEPRLLADLRAEARLAALALAFHPRGWWWVMQMGLNNAGEREESWGYRLSGLAASQAAAGLRLLPKLDLANRRRRRNGEHLMAQLVGIEGVALPAIDPDTEPIFLRLPVLVRDEARCEAIFRRLRSEGIGVGRMYRRPLTAIFPEIETRRDLGAQLVARSLLTLPTHHYLTDADLARIVDVVAHERR